MTYSQNTWRADEEQREVNTLLEKFEKQLIETAQQTEELNN